MKLVIAVDVGNQWEVHDTQLGGEELVRATGKAAVDAFRRILEGLETGDASEVRNAV
jgi:hypothetical protein